MKFLKLLGIFVVLLGVVVGALFLSTDDIEVQTEDESLVDQSDQLISKIRNKWGTATAWDADLFREQEDDITRFRSSKLISESNKRELTHLLHITVIQKVKNRVFEEYGKTDCSYQVVEDNMKGIDIICQRQSDWKANPDVKLLNDCFMTYKTIRSFARSSFSLDTKLEKNSDGTHQWRDYKSYMSSMESTAAGHRSNDIYREYLSNISELKDGLASENVKKKLNLGCTDYATKLATKLVEDYPSSADDWDASTKNSIDVDFKRFDKEYSKKINQSANDQVYQLWKDITNHVAALNSNNK